MERKSYNTLRYGWMIEEEQQVYFDPVECVECCYWLQDLEPGTKLEPLKLVLCEEKRMYFDIENLKEHLEESLEGWDLDYWDSDHIEWNPQDLKLVEGVLNILMNTTRTNIYQEVGQNYLMIDLEWDGDCVIITEESYSFWKQWDNMEKLKRELEVKR